MSTNLTSDRVIGINEVRLRKGASNKEDWYLEDKQTRELGKMFEHTNMLPNCSLCRPICSEWLQLFKCQALAIIRPLRMWATMSSSDYIATGPYRIHGYRVLISQSVGKTSSCTRFHVNASSNLHFPVISRLSRYFICKKNKLQILD